MIPLMHEVNTIQAWKKTPERFGIEVDVSERNNQIIMEHDPFTDGEAFENLLSKFNHNYDFLRRHFKICLGAPDLLGRKQDIKTYREQLKKIHADNL